MGAMCGAESVIDEDVAQRRQLPGHLRLIGFLALLTTHAIYWILTHPVNNFWLRTQNLGGLGDRFFNINRLREGESDQAGEGAWLRLRDRWEYSHVLRAIFSAVGLLALLVSVSLK